MASITINPVFIQEQSSLDMSGLEKVLIINSDGKPAAMSVNKLLDQFDDQIDESIENALDNLDNTVNLKWNEVYD